MTSQPAESSTGGTRGAGASGSSTSSSGSSSSSTELSAESGALQSSKGTTQINDAVVTKIAGIAAREVPGVHDLGGGAARALGSVTQAMGVGPDQRSQGVTVEVGEEEAAVDLVLIIDYGESIPNVSEQIRENVIRRIEGIAGLRVTEVNISVRDLYFPGDEADAEA